MASGSESTPQPPGADPVSEQEHENGDESEVARAARREVREAVRARMEAEAARDRLQQELKKSEEARAVAEAGKKHLQEQFNKQGQVVSTHNIVWANWRPGRS